MMRESVETTAPPARRIEPMSIQIPLETLPATTTTQAGESCIEKVFNRFCPEVMETKTKIYIAILLILPSLIYFLVTVNSPHTRIHTPRVEEPSSLNITMLKDYDTNEDNAFKLAVEHDQAILPNAIKSEIYEELEFSRSSRDTTVDPVVSLLGSVLDQ